MKRNGMVLAAIFLLMFTLACAHSPTVAENESDGVLAKKIEILQIAVEVAKSMNFPKVTRFDKENGIVEFGRFGQAVEGITAQVRVSSDNSKVNVSVKRGSTYVPASAEVTGQEFLRKFREEWKKKQAI